MLQVRSPSRLHFGLLSLPADDVSARRHFGGVGLMIDEPGIRVSAQTADSWSAEGPLAERALGFARKFSQSLSTSRPFHVIVEACPPQHVGLGTGTQLGLAVAQALASACGLEGIGAVELARRIGRGQRSALGIHGFANGGFLVEGGKGPNSGVAPLIARADFPSTWSIVLILPQGESGRHGEAEERAFHGLRTGQTEPLCRLVLMGMLPAVVEVDLPAFGEAVYEFNRRVGEMFKPVQGGIYAHSRSGAMVDFIREQKVAGVGQSSWGPAIFAIVEKDRADSLTRNLRAQFCFSPAEVLVTRASRAGATVVRNWEKGSDRLDSPSANR